MTTDVVLLDPPSWMPDWLVAPLIGGFSLADFLGLFVLLNFILVFVMFEIWLERKVGGHIQLRRGPGRRAPRGAAEPGGRAQAAHQRGSAPGRRAPAPEGYRPGLQPCSDPAAPTLAVAHPIRRHRRARWAARGP